MSGTFIPDDIIYAVCLVVISSEYHSPYKFFYTFILKATWISLYNLLPETNKTDSSLISEMRGFKNLAWGEAYIVDLVYY